MALFPLVSRVWINTSVFPLISTRKALTTIKTHPEMYLLHIRKDGPGHKGEVWQSALLWPSRWPLELDVNLIVVLMK